MIGRGPWFIQLLLLLRPCHWHFFLSLSRHYCSCLSRVLCFRIRLPNATGTRRPCLLLRHSLSLLERRSGRPSLLQPWEFLCSVFSLRLSRLSASPWEPQVADAS